MTTIQLFELKTGDRIICQKSGGCFDYGEVLTIVSTRKNLLNLETYNKHLAPTISRFPHWDNVFIKYNPIKCPEYLKRISNDQI